MAKTFFVITAPSGSGKTTLMKRVLQKVPNLEFSISATTRPKREHEIEGRDYYFLTVEEFTDSIDKGKFIEWEQVYPKKYYGTLKSEIQRISDKENIAVLDIDVLGATEIKKQFGDKVEAVFIAPPSIDKLRERLENRGTETSDTMQERLNRVSFEMSYRDQFDHVVVNDDLDKATDELVAIFSSEA